MKKIAALFVCLLFLGACSDDDFDENKQKDKLIGTWEGVWETKIEKTDVTVIFTDTFLQCLRKRQPIGYIDTFIYGTYQIVNEGVILYQNTQMYDGGLGGKTTYSLNGEYLDFYVFDNLKRISTPQ